jgi:hypothetical protein
MLLEEAYRKPIDIQYVSIGNMVRLTRRNVLQDGSGALLAAFAGCSTFSQEPSPDPSFSHIDAVNKTPTARTLHVLILRGDEPVYSASREMPPPEHEDDYNFVYFDGLPETVGDHILYAWHDSHLHNSQYPDHFPSCSGRFL